MGQKTTMPSRLTDLKKEIISKDPAQQELLVQSWKDLLRALAVENKLIAEQGSNVSRFISVPMDCVLRLIPTHPTQRVPVLDFKEFEKWTAKDVENAKTRGCVVIRNVVDDDDAIAWRKELQRYVKENPTVEGQWCLYVGSLVLGSNIVYQARLRMTSSFSNFSTLS